MARCRYFHLSLNSNFILEYRSNAVFIYLACDVLLALSTQKHRNPNLAHIRCIIFPQIIHAFQNFLFLLGLAPPTNDVTFPIRDLVFDECRIPPYFVVTLFDARLIKSYLSSNGRLSKSTHCLLNSSVDIALSNDLSKCLQAIVKCNISGIDSSLIKHYERF